MRQHPSTILLLAFFIGGLTGCANKYVDLLGQPAPVTAAQRTIVINPDTKYVNVEGGQIVKFVVGDKAFAWDFFVARTIGAFDLNAVAPPGMLDHPVRAYVSPDPRYIGDDGGHW
jgi:hypothetical protein